MPSAAIASFYGVPLAEMEAGFWQAVNTPHAVIEENGNRVKQALASGREIRIRTQEGTDLRLKLVNERGVHLSDGQIHKQPVDKPEQVWLPAGEVYTVPDATSVNGTVFVPLADYRGIKIRDLRLTFVNGKVTRIEAAQNAEALKQALAQSSGDKDVFSFVDIGVNPNSRTIGKSNYFTFEMAGMVTIGIGQAPWAPGCTNQSEFGQAFFIPRATLEVDGKPIVTEGKIAI
jgi:leucyl aminopeptidase (aminopeptidase T)